MTERSLSRPVVLLARGGSGSRLLSWLAQDVGVFIGNDINACGDALEMVPALYQGVFKKYLLGVDFHMGEIVLGIRRAAQRMLARRGAGGIWGFKLPESMLLVPEIEEAFNQPRYLHLLRDPLAVCLRRTHLTAQFDNPIGRVAIPEAYRHCGREPAESLQDSPAVHMAYTTIHQVEIVRKYAHSHLSGRFFELRFEQMLEGPGDVLASVTDWLGAKAVGNKLEREVDPERAANPSVTYSSEVQQEVTRILAPLRKELGYP